MATDKRTNLSESELNARYTAAAYKFATVSNWRDYLALAEEFRALDTYKDSAQKYSQCVKAASAPAYRDITDEIRTKGAETTAAEYREAARIMQIIQDYQDAREVMRVYTVRANALTYDAAMTLLSNSEATTEELGEGVELLKSIKGFKNTRELIERFEKYYFDRMYNEALHLMEHGHVFSEFEEAAEKFEKISVYSDAAQQAAACRKMANKVRPKEKKKKEKPADAAPAKGGDEVVRVTHKDAKPAKEAPGTEGEEVVKPRKRRMIDDETHNSLAEVWHNIDKRRMVEFIIWMLLLIGDLYASIVLPNIQTDFFIANANSIRIITVLLAIFFIAMGGRAFLRMLTASMRKKLGQAAVKFARKLAAPLVKAVNKLLLSIGIDLSRRNRLSGRDEKTFVFDDTEKVKKAKKKLKNDLKWVEQTDNAARVRFIFIDYMIRRIKKGYFMKRCMTPVEICDEIALEDDEKALFAVYNKARYAGKMGVEEITDAMVGELQMVNRKRNQ
ncbi:MAG: hypothetical protein J6K29_11705 [Clostridia bacterium]|nr:hypothetical protein [Clostridia bacterium]